MIRYLDSAESVSAGQLEGFFVGWPNPPTSATHLKILQGSQHILLALDDSTSNVVGFITAISDGVLSAYIPLLEVLPPAQGQGIGKQLVERMLAQLERFYMVDLLCDASVQPFYAQFQLREATGMMRRNYDRQDGA